MKNKDIILLEKLTGKKVFLESPDWIDANTNKVGTWVGKLSWKNEDAVPFGLKNGQMFIGERQDMHDSIGSIVTYKITPQEIKNKYSGSPKRREEFDFPGRIWLDSKIISFWQYPKTTGDLNNIVKQLQEEIKTVLDEDIDLVNKGFVEVYLDEDDGVPEFEPYFRPGNVKIIPIKDYDKFLSGKLLTSLNEKVLLEKKSKFEKLEKNKIPLTDEERKEVFKRDATWAYAESIDPNTGKKVKKVSAVWKSKDPKTGEITYVTNTHRAYNTAPTLKGAISRYHKFIKGTA